MGIGAEFEFFHPMGLEVMFFPDALHARGTDSLGLGHGTDAPMSGIFGSTVQSSLNNDGFLFGRNLPRATEVWSTVGEPAPYWQFLRRHVERFGSGVRWIAECFAIC